MFPQTRQKAGQTMLLALSLLFLVSLLFRFGIIYMTGDRHLTVPDFYFARDKIGRDFEYGAMKNARDFLKGTYDRKETYYGPAFAITLAGTFPLAGLSDECRNIDSETCTTYYYRVFVLLSVMLLVLLAVCSIEDRMNKSIALISIALFLLGIPGARGLETGNIDIFLSGVFGITIWLFVISNDTRRMSPLRYVLIGMLFGWLANTKIFLLPFALIAMITSIQPLPIVAGFFVSFFGNSLLPIIFGSQTSLADPFVSSTKAITVFSHTLFANYPGNNSITTFVTFPTQNIYLALLATLCIGILIFVLPFFSIGSNGLIQKLRSPAAALAGFALFVAGISILPPVSFDYRLYYLLAYLIACLGVFRNKKAVTLLYVALFSLLTKSIWIEHARFMNIFLLLSCSFCIRASVIEWNKSP